MKALLALLAMLAIAPALPAQSIERRDGKLWAIWVDPAPRFIIYWSTDLVLWWPWARIEFFEERLKPHWTELELADSDTAQFWKIEPLP